MDKQNHLNSHITDKGGFLDISSFPGITGNHQGYSRVNFGFPACISRIYLNEALCN